MVTLVRTLANQRGENDTEQEREGNRAEAVLSARSSVVCLRLFLEL